MDWSDEPWVKLYRRNTADWMLLSWRARGLFYSLMREVNRSGVLDLGRTGKRAVAVVLGDAHAHVEIVAALEELLADGCVQINGTALVIPNFVEAQDAAQSDKARAKALRERRRDVAMGVEPSDATVTKRDGSITKRDGSITKRDGSITDSDETVTPRHAASHGVTPRHEEKRREEKTRDEGSAEGAPAPTPPPSAETASGAHATSTTEEQTPAKRKRTKPAPSPDTIPAPNTLARRVYDAILADRVLCPIVGNPGDAAERWADPATFPGVDVLAEVRRAGEYAATKPGRYTDGRAFLRNWLKSKSDEAAARLKPAAHVPGVQTVAPPPASRAQAPKTVQLPQGWGKPPTERAS